MGKKNFRMLIITINLFIGYSLYSADQYYYGENIGWLNSQSTYGSITVSDTKLSGWIWGENTGWIKLDTAFSSVNIDQDMRCSGFAYGENIGWVNFSPAHGGVKVIDGKLQGWVWGENIGWIRLNLYSGKTGVFPNYIDLSIGDKVRIVIGKSCNAEIKIYNIVGAIVKSYAKQYYNNGEFKEWDGTIKNTGKKVGAGVYFVVIKGDGVNAKLKLIIKK